LFRREVHDLAAAARNSASTMAQAWLVKPTPMWAARFDVRRYETRKPFDLFLKDGWPHQTEVSAGVGPF
jgi:hypothetical protein